jgi:hypothetical protein
MCRVLDASENSIDEFSRGDLVSWVSFQRQFQMFISVKPPVGFRRRGLDLNPLGASPLHKSRADRVGHKHVLSITALGAV